jgi:hypothetical protein
LLELVLKLVMGAGAETDAACSRLTLMLIPQARAVSKSP